MTGGPARFRTWLRLELRLGGSFHWYRRQDDKLLWLPWLPWLYRTQYLQQRW